MASIVDLLSYLKGHQKGINESLVTGLNGGRRRYTYPVNPDHVFQQLADASHVQTCIVCYREQGEQSGNAWPMHGEK